MSETAESVFAAAMSLPDPEREALTLKLLDCLPPPEEWEEVSEDEIVAEVLRRHEEAQRQPSDCTPAEEVHGRLLGEIHADTSRSQIPHHR